MTHLIRAYKAGDRSQLLLEELYRSFVRSGKISAGPFMKTLEPHDLCDHWRWETFVNDPEVNEDPSDFEIKLQQRAQKEVGKSVILRDPGIRRLDDSERIPLKNTPYQTGYVKEQIVMHYLGLSPYYPMGSWIFALKGGSRGLTEVRYFIEMISGEHPLPIHMFLGRSQLIHGGYLFDYLAFEKIEDWEDLTTASMKLYFSASLDWRVYRREAEALWRKSHIEAFIDGPNSC
ncbi:MAG: hypothetical protein GF334_11175 [Candidatus Altiarchaeales archaeon]|nr:hypothetical protein [Candidatus Altiarchaeales archaeon]